MDPSTDFNGASRRALTIAFTLALAKVSGVDAPNVIDTPLGMMSGYVKTEVVRISAENCNQLVLFLTHDEIKGCEEILEKFLGACSTITNPAHYPKILKNKPPETKGTVVQCDCGIRSDCKICSRHEQNVTA